ncbi:hypothetical protein AKJ16_DCAP15115, partial [Drosera capensis]
MVAQIFHHRTKASRGLTDGFSLIALAIRGIMVDLCSRSSPWMKPRVREEARHQILIGYYSMSRPLILICSNGKRASIYGAVKKGRDLVEKLKEMAEEVGLDLKRCNSLFACFPDVCFLENDQHKLCWSASVGCCQQLIYTDISSANPDAR